MMTRSCLLHSRPTTTMFAAPCWTTRSDVGTSPDVPGGGITEGWFPLLRLRHLGDVGDVSTWDIPRFWDLDRGTWDISGV